MGEEERTRPKVAGFVACSSAYAEPNLLKSAVRWRPNCSAGVMGMEVSRAFAGGSGMMQKFKWMPIHCGYVAAIMRATLLPRSPPWTMYLFKPREDVMSVLRRKATSSRRKSRVSGGEDEKA